MRNIYEDYDPQETKTFWIDILRGIMYMLFYGGIAGVIGYALHFCLGLAVEYFYYKEEVLEYIVLAIVLVVQPVFVGFKYVENCGYVDSFDQTFGVKSFLKRIGLASAGMMIIPLMIMMKVNFLIIYVYDLCYYGAEGVGLFLSETFFHQIDKTTPLGMFLGSLITFTVYLFVYIFFYRLGRKHHMQDVEAGIKISVV